MTDAPRRAEVQRTTRETEIRLTLQIDGTGCADVSTGVGFLDHMLDLFARHALLDLTAYVRGDRQVDDHHATEDVGIVLGQALDRALGDKAGIRRYGHCVLPMDEVLVTCAVDLGGRAYLGWDAAFRTPKVGCFDTELIQEFWRAFSLNARANVHVLMHRGGNSHHLAEAIFKGLARAVRDAVELDPRGGGAIPSTKGTL
ncbi:MAG: imidazoleglycerol-phosphate dehydratase [Isosphaeraceae bacterium]|nr:MAG: imidazoleglycerol-phosphate dehydratase [Isosphaeraceae bacterium]